MPHAVPPTWKMTLSWHWCLPHPGKTTRQQARQSHQEQFNRVRFRRQSVEYLAALEKRWEQTLHT